MNKQEEIREGIAKTICLWHIGKPLMWEMGEDSPTWEGPPKKDYYEVADMVMTGESSQGVVIKVERELPKDPFYHSEGQVWMNDVGEAGKRGYETAQQDMLRAGYVPVEPLI